MLFFLNVRFELYSLPFSNAPLFVSVLKAVLHNFTKHLHIVSWYGLHFVVTSLSPSFRHIWMAKFFETGFEFYWHQLFSCIFNAPSLVSVLKTVLHNFTKQLNEVWWYSLDPVVTSLQPQLSPNPDDKEFFWGQIWVLLTTGFPTRHRLSLYEQQNSQCLKTVFCGVYALPTSPSAEVTALRSSSRMAL